MSEYDIAMAAIEKIETIVDEYCGGDRNDVAVKLIQNEIVKVRRTRFFSVVNIYVEELWESIMMLYSKSGSRRYGLDRIRLDISASLMKIENSIIYVNETQAD